MCFALLIAYSFFVVGAVAQTPPDRTDAVAREAVDAALALPPGHKRDTVLRAVSRNPRWFSQPDEGVRAARAMMDGAIRAVALSGAVAWRCGIRSGLREPVFETIDASDL